MGSFIELAASILLLLLTMRLGHFGGLEAHQVGQLVDDDLPRGRGLVHPLNAAPLPVGPVDVVAQQREAKDMGQLVLQQGQSVAPVHIDDLEGDGGRDGSEQVTTPCSFNSSDGGTLGGRSKGVNKLWGGPWLWGSRVAFRHEKYLIVDCIQIKDV